MAREIRSERLQVLVTPSDKAALEKVCEAQGVTISDYLRSAMLFSLLMDRHPQGFKAVGKGLAMLTSEVVQAARQLRAKAA